MKSKGEMVTEKDKAGVKQNKSKWRADPSSTPNGKKIRGTHPARIRRRKAFTHYSAQLTAGEGKQFILSVMHL